MKRHVFRIENHLGDGFYTCGGLPNSIRDCIGANLYDSKRHKIPEDDVLLNKFWAYSATAKRAIRKRDDDYADRWNWNFGYASIRQLKNWLHSEEIRRTMNKGKTLRLAIYEVDDDFFHMGESQCVFVRAEAHLVEVIVDWNEDVLYDLEEEYPETMYGTPPARPAKTTKKCPPIAPSRVLATCLPQKRNIG